jgi:SEC-C motif-containing protein
LTQPCPCGSTLAFSECCKPYLSGQENATTPGILMRSRYTAYATKDVDYLIASWHPDCGAEKWRNSILESFTQTMWLDLRILSEIAGSHDREGFVEFSARYQEGSSNKVSVMHERSRFIQLNERWYYIDGIHPQSGRNDPCPCGSGKKYKKCCGQ